MPPAEMSSTRMSAPYLIRALRSHVQIARPQSFVNAAILAWFHRHIERIGDANDLQRGSVQFRAGHLNLGND